MCMVKRMSLNDDQFREVMVRESAAKHGEDQHGERMIKGVDRAVSNQTALNVPVNFCAAEYLQSHEIFMIILERSTVIIFSVCSLSSLKKLILND